MIAVVLVIMPTSAFAQYQTQYPAAKFPVGTCQNLEGGSGAYQQQSDGTWAPPTSLLNNCAGNNNLGWNNYSSQYGYNPLLGSMSAAQWVSHCMLGGTFLPLPECQGYSPYFGGTGNQASWYNSLMQYPQFGRDYLSIYGNGLSFNIDLSSLDNNNNNNSSSSSHHNSVWTDVLIGAGMGWLFNRLTS